MPDNPSVFTIGTHHKVYPAIDPRANTSLSTSLRGHNAIITGAGRGIGRQIALFFTHASISFLTIIALEPSELAETADLCRAINPEIQILERAFDVCDAGKVEDLVKEVEGKFGGVDVLVCNAGRPPQWLKTSESDVGIWWDTVCTSLQHPFLFTRFILPGMQKRKSGRIIYTSSSGAHAVQGFGSYAVGKLGAVRLAEIVHNENFADFGIKTFAFNPGAVRTRFFTDFEDKVMGKGKEGSYVEDGIEGQEKSAKTAYETLKDADFDEPELAAGFVTKLASGELDFMSGRYADVRVDVEEYIRDKDAILRDDLHKVKLHISGSSEGHARG